MFVNVVAFPPVAEGRDADFRAWFEWSTPMYAGIEGFVSRRLLEETKVPGRYATTRRLGVGMPGLGAGRVSS